MLILDDEGKKALIAAIKAVEARSSVEVVIAARRSASGYRMVDLAIGVAVTLAALAFMLFSDFPFGTLALFVDPALAGLIAVALSLFVPIAKRWLVPRAIRRAAVERAARATFVELGVHRTKGRTGVLVFLALLEGMVELVVDTEVERHLDEGERSDLRSAIERALPQRGIATAKAIETLGDLVEARLPRMEDDENELPDEVA